METAEGKPKFSGGVPEIYQKHLVPLIFDVYAADTAARIAALAPEKILEIAAGTGAVTRALAKALPASTSILATDLNPPMLAQAQALGTSRPVEWGQADALNLPYPDASFDAVVCQFGAMFFPDKPKGFAEARRVLEPGGTYLFTVWDSVASNPFAAIMGEALAKIIPKDTPKFLEKIPHGYYEAGTIRGHLATGGFTENVRIETVPMRCRAVSAMEAAIAYCLGTPTRGDVEAREPARMQEFVDLTAKLIAERYGNGPVEAGIQALVITARK